MGHTAKDNRIFLEAVLYRYRTGIPWQDLPERFGDWKNTHRRWRKWSVAGVWQKVFKNLCLAADNQNAMIDSTIVRAHQHSSGAKKKEEKQCTGRSREGLSTKIHATVDAKGKPTSFTIKAGQQQDIVGADLSIHEIEANTIIADKSYDAVKHALSTDF